MLESISSPKDLRELTADQLETLAREIREFLITKVSKSGGHLGPNLGVVELTIALHCTFDSPKDVLLFDTGHQSYVHKILTGRSAGFDQLRKRGGLAGYPSRVESVHDVIENSHASTALSWGDGISHGFSLRGESDRFVVVVVGDGALTGGMSWEALNNISAAAKRNLVIVVNDNKRSYSPTIGGLAAHLSTLRTTQGFEEFLEWGKDIIAPQGLFEDLGLKYFGPIDGHDISAMTRALTIAKNFGSPIIVHVITEKGHGHPPALDDVDEKFHAVGVIDPFTGTSLTISGRTWTSVFGKEIVEIGKSRPDVVAITAAMLGPTGLSEFQRTFPHRTMDVGIAEQHAVTSAAGMAFAGLHPIFAVYSTFLNRAFDQMLLDVALHRAGVTFVLDRSGITGDDGPSHNGVWDLAISGIVPRLHVGAPRDGARLKELLQEAVCISDAPTLIRFPKGEVIADIEALERREGIDLLRIGTRQDLLIVGVGAFAELALDSADLVAEVGVECTVVDPRWVKPIPERLIEMTRDFSGVVVIEDGISHAGIASTFSEELRKQGIRVPLHAIGVPLEFIEHSKRTEILEDLGLTPREIARSLVHFLEHSIIS